MCLHVVLRYPEAVLRVGFALIRRQAIPPHRFGVVLQDATVVGVNDPEVELGLERALERMQAAAEPVADAATRRTP